eukprot:Polyplicarium_translucidae@DN2529_c0_g2_i1.p1
MAMRRPSRCRSPALLRHMSFANVKASCRDEDHRDLHLPRSHTSERGPGSHGGHSSGRLLPTRPETFPRPPSPHPNHAVLDVSCLRRTTPGKGLSLVLTFKWSLLESARWSDSVQLTYPPAQDDAIVRVQLASSKFAPVEVEVYTDARDFAPYVKGLDSCSIACVISATRWFVDRTGLGIRPCTTYQYFPRFNEGISLLGDSRTADVSLLVPNSTSDKDICKCAAKIPAIGHSTDAPAESDERYLSLFLQTERIAATDTAGALSKIVFLMPKYVVTNDLGKDIHIQIRQTTFRRILADVRPGASEAIHWCK